MTEGEQGERMKALEDLIAELVKFTRHDEACAELKDEDAPCTCGLRRVYEKVDELVEF